MPASGQEFRPTSLPFGLEELAPLPSLGAPEDRVQDPPTPPRQTVGEQSPPEAMGVETTSLRKDVAPHKLDGENTEVDRIVGQREIKDDGPVGAIDAQVRV